MTYHTLINREPRFVSGYWKWIIVSALLLVALSTFILAFIFHAFLLNFNSNCIANTQLAFKTFPPYVLEKLTELDEFENGKNGQIISNRYYEIDGDYVKLKEYIDKIKLHYNLTNVNENEMTSSKRNSKFYKLWNSLKENDEKRNLKNDAKDIDFFETKTIYDFRTRWGSMVTCNYFCFTPLLQGVIAIIWLAFFLICGYSKNKNHSFIDEPWKIVIPSLTFFIAMTVCSFIYIGFLHAKIRGFCYGFKYNLYNQDIPCSLIFNRFAIDHHTLFEPATNYLLSIVFAWLSAILWTATVVIMILRCVLASDFQVVNISISNVIIPPPTPPMLPSPFNDEDEIERQTDFEQPKKTIEFNHEKKIKITDENNQYILIPRTEIDMEKLNSSPSPPSPPTRTSASKNVVAQQRSNFNKYNDKIEMSPENESLFRETPII